jgi:hypothetical protein
MRSAWHTVGAMGAILVLSFATTGCVTSKKYKMVKTDSALPAHVLDWRAAAPPAELTLRSLIVFKGPGSWNGRRDGMNIKSR